MAASGLETALAAMQIPEAFWRGTVEVDGIGHAPADYTTERLDK
jgi:hypothetical protein